MAAPRSISRSATAAAISDLSKLDQELVLQCIRAIAEGSAITDPEFQTRLGGTRATLGEIISRWPAVDDRGPGSHEFLAANNCLNEICNGTPMAPEEWALRFTEAPETVNQTYKNWLRLSGCRGSR
jgi:hypothetical protein